MRMRMSMLSLVVVVWSLLVVTLLPVVVVQAQSPTPGFFQRTRRPGAIVALTLLNVDTDEVLGTLRDGDVFELESAETRVRIEPVTIGRIGSVAYTVGDDFTRASNAAPYSLLANRWIGQGPITVEATTFLGLDGMGFAGETFGVTFEITGPPPTTAPPSTAIADPTASPVDEATNSPTTLTMAPTLTPVSIDLSSCDVDPDPVTPMDTDVAAYPASATGLVSGELRKWHKITVGFTGPVTCERALPNPFTDYRLDVTFQAARSRKTWTVPGYYAADGNAANTGAVSGNVWLAHFSPNVIGSWNYTVSFTYGPTVAQNGDGVSAGFMDGATGTFEVLNTDKEGRDLRAKGRLLYVGEHHLQFDDTEEWFLKAGADSPENFLAYDDFDNTLNEGGRRKSWEPHAQDYVAGQPTWGGGKGTEILGAVNYLSDQGMNVFSFLTMNIGGDDKNVFPYVSNFTGADRQIIDVSKTAQWEVLFEHADTMGMYLHFKTQEEENDQLLDEGELGDERKLYYRELVARFGHHLALNWNLGEETTNTPRQRRLFAEYIRATDPYDHLIVAHTYIDEKERRYEPLLGNTDFDGASLQSRKDQVFNDTLTWVTRSAETGRKWVVANDEQGTAIDGVVPDADDPTHDVVRQQVLWGNILAGGAGVEYYFGYNFTNSDLTCQDFRSRANMWVQSKHALDFFRDNSVPFWEMSNANDLVSGEDNWLMKQSSDETIVVYLKNGGTATVSLSSDMSYSVQWYNPRTGGALQTGSVDTVSGTASIGDPPADLTADWVVLLTGSTTTS